jgi:hypothetical protein
MKTKICTKCGIEKLSSEFYKDKQKATGYRPDCKTCNKAKCLEWARNNTHRRKYYILKHGTGLTKVQYEEFLTEQNYKCAICDRDVSEITKNLSVDHCHKTNLIRGLLCNKCNFGLGYFNDDSKLLNNALKYLSNNASIKGIKFKNNGKNIAH